MLWKTGFATWAKSKYRRGYNPARNIGDIEWGHSIHLVLCMFEDKRHMYTLRSGGMKIGGTVLGNWPMRKKLTSMICLIREDSGDTSPRETF